MLAGKNGSGKSRILQYVQEVAADAAVHRPRIDQIRAEVKHYEGLVAASHAWNGLPDYSGHLATLKSNVEAVEALDFDGSNNRVIRFVPTAGDFHDPDHMTTGTRRSSASNLTNVDAGGWNQVVLAYIVEVQNRWYETSHQSSSAPISEKLAAEISYFALRDAVEGFFETRLDRDPTGSATLFDKAIAAASLSSGQKIALQLITALHAQASSLGSAILIMDEPENHLHPAAVVQLLRRIEEIAPDVQIWIATHSVPLLSYVNSKHPSAIWAVTHGKAEFAGKRPAEVIKGLLGDDESIGHLVSFMSLPHHLAANNYAYQCLLPPATLMTASDDPQLGQIRTALDELRGAGSLNVVDYGAGKGRLIHALRSGGHDGEGAFEYVAYDPFACDQEQCKQAICEVYGTSDARYFNDVEDLLASRMPGWADCVVMTNVLHEVPVAQWVLLFGPGGLLRRVLKEDGYLLIVEDQRIPVGEMAHQHGFLLMNTNELVTFFAVNASDRQSGAFVSIADRGGRLTAHLVRRDLFARVTNESRKESILAIRQLAATKIRALRSADKTYDNGLLHALWTQQMANASLALEDFYGL
ncbi:AAA family ATPase [Stenotrophomonas sp. 2619]|uniref:AAA family ATPase n=1 Tax=Stenotrophomonas sp. 2619 TaxID=3156316 RepID=UPI0033942022